jgi:hypothetical protein
MNGIENLIKRRKEKIQGYKCMFAGSRTENKREKER